MTHSTFCEHIVKQKCQGKFLIAKILLGALYGAIAIVPSFIIIMFAPPYLIIPFLLVIASVIFVLFRLTWKYTNVEYEYQVVEDTILFTRIIGRSKRVCDIEMPIRAFFLLGAQKMQEEMEAKQAELEEKEYDIKAGGGVVSVKINGRKEILSIDIQPEIVDPDDVETLSDILVAAVNEAIKRVESVNNAEMQKITGGMGMPGMF